MGFRDRRRAAAAPWRERRTTTTTLGGWATPATNQLANAVLLVGALVGDAYSWLLGALVARAWDADRQGPPARAGQRSPHAECRALHAAWAHQHRPLRRLTAS